MPRCGGPSRSSRSRAASASPPFQLRGRSTITLYMSLRIWTPETKNPRHGRGFCGVRKQLRLVPLGFRGDATREAQGLRAGAYEMCSRVVCKFISFVTPMWGRAEYLFRYGCQEYSDMNDGCRD